MIDPNELAFLITSVAVTVSQMVPDDDQLNILSLAYTQLGDTLATIAEQRRLIAEKKGQDNSKQDNSKQDNSKQDNSKQDNLKQDNLKQDNLKQDNLKQDNSNLDELPNR